MKYEISKIKIGTRLRGAKDTTKLAQSIADVGLMNPITITQDGKLVAGYHRLKACEQLGWKEIPVNIVKLDDIKRELAEIDENLIRNELTALERGEQLARRKEIYEALHPQTKKGAVNQHTKLLNPESGNSSFVSDTASKTGHSKAKVAEEVAFVSGKRALPEAVRDLIRDTPIADNKQELRRLSNLSTDEQRKAAQAIANGARSVKEANRALKAERKKPSPLAGKMFELHRSDIADAIDLIAAESVDAIITDPPYPREYIETFSALARFALHALKPGGSLVCMTGQLYLPDYLDRLRIDGLRYQWMCSYLTPGGQATQVHPRKVNTFWKPLIWFVKGDYERDWIGDVCKSAVNDNDKQHHHWGQSESGMADIVDRFTDAGHVVCDPFCGGGTTGVVAVARGRRFIGIDIEQSHLDTTAGRLA